MHKSHNGRTIVRHKDRSLRAQFFDVLTADFDFAFVLAGCREVVG
jgi:hypothetical protein